MTRLRAALGFVSILSMSAIAGSAGATGQGARAAAIEALADQALAARPATGVAPGCAISVTHQGEGLFAKAYGHADLERAAPFSLQTVSETGSVAKQFAAAQVLLLAEDGRLSLEDDVRKYLPEMPDYGEPIRIYDLLHQLSGIREYSTLAALRGYPRFYKTLYDLDSVFALISAQRSLNFRPGARYEYSNSNYVLLTLIAQRVSGMPAAEFGRRRLFEPLGMRSTEWRDDLRRVTPGRALAYRAAGAGYELYMPFENTYGHGALLTTVGDLQRWNDALMSGRLSAYVTRHMLTPGRLRDGEQRAYGAGIVLADHRGHRVFRHGGVTAGYTAQLWAFPDDRLSIALLCNARAGDVAQLVGRVADAALGLPPEARPAAETSPKKSPQSPTFYRAENGEMLALSTDGASVSLDLFTSQGPLALATAAGTGDLRGSTPFGNLQLRREAGGRLVLEIDDREATVFATMPPAPPTPPPTGRYWNADLRAAFILSRTDDGYRLDLEDRQAADPVGFRLEWLNGDAYRARIETRSGYIRDDMIVNFTRPRGHSAKLRLSSVAGLQAVDLLEFTHASN